MLQDAAERSNLGWLTSVVSCRIVGQKDRRRGREEERERERKTETVCECVCMYVEGRKRSDQTDSSMVSPSKCSGIVAGTKVSVTKDR